MRRGTKRSTSAGFTLIELMAVLFIAGILALASIPAFQAVQQGRALRTAARQVSTAVDLARQHAITRRQNTRFVVVARRSTASSSTIFDQFPSALSEQADKVLCAYSICTVDAFGNVIDYVRPWEYFPRGVVLDDEHDDSTFTTGGATPVISVPIPDSESSDYAPVHFVEFKPTGAATEGKTLVLTRGSVLAARDDDGALDGRFDYSLGDTSVVWKISVNNITGHVRTEEEI